VIIDIVEYLEANSTTKTKKEVRGWIFEAFYLVGLSNEVMLEPLSEEDL